MFVIKPKINQPFAIHHPKGSMVKMQIVPRDNRDTYSISFEANPSVYIVREKIWDYKTYLPAKVNARGVMGRLVLTFSPNESAYLVFGPLKQPAIGSEFLNAISSGQLVHLRLMKSHDGIKVAITADKMMKIVIDASAYAPSPSFIPVEFGPNQELKFDWNFEAKY